MADFLIDTLVAPIRRKPCLAFMIFLLYNMLYVSRKYCTSRDNGMTTDERTALGFGRGVSKNILHIRDIKTIAESPCG